MAIVVGRKRFTRNDQIFQRFLRDCTLNSYHSIWLETTVAEVLYGLFNARIKQRNIVSCERLQLVNTIYQRQKRKQTRRTYEICIERDVYDPRKTSITIVFLVKCNDVRFCAYVLRENKFFFF